MERQILHIDCNKFYASVECFLHPELRDKPVAVGGDEESRHGIILTKNEIASKYGLTVGEPIWKAKQKCRNLIIVTPNFPTYIEFSKKVRSILEDYTDLIEPFGLDESWIDVSGDWFKNGRERASKKRSRNNCKCRRKLQQNFCKARFGLQKAERYDSYNKKEL